MASPGQGTHASQAQFFYRIWPCGKKQVTWTAAQTSNHFFICGPSPSKSSFICCMIVIFCDQQRQQNGFIEIRNRHWHHPELINECVPLLHAIPLAFYFRLTRFWELLAGAWLATLGQKQPTEFRTHWMGCSCIKHGRVGLFVCVHVDLHFVHPLPGWPQPYPWWEQRSSYKLALLQPSIA